jgi:hydrogenase maturation protein HypF
VSARIRKAVRVEGIVQGVGFRPFVYSLATSLGLGGLVGNDVDGVFAEVEGPAAVVAKFLALLAEQAPPLARIDRVSTSDMPPDGLSAFAIAPSQRGGARRALVSADSAPCADCLAEFDDPADRRFRYPFINCTNCGPRFTIIEDVPYDRQLTTMARFEMCALCAAEYHDPADRRFHAQPVCCPACGPRLRLLDGAGNDLCGPQGVGEPVAAAASLLRAGQVLAVKGLGGFHLAVDAGHQSAAAALRARKHREDKPFAVMVPDVAAARELCEVAEAAEALLTSGRRPIVLLPRRREPPAGAARGAGGVAAAVAPGNRQLGVMLPYTPLHHLLLRAVGGPIVLTSGNISDEPIVFTDADALDRLSGIADAFLTHDRPIHIRTDDSVVRVFRGGGALIRRSRGYVPEPLGVPVRFVRPVLACGAELKSTFCLGVQRHAFVSHHIGDLENVETLRSFTEGIEHFRRLFGIEPLVVAHDLHPEYLSTKYAAELADAGLADAGLAGAGLAGAGLVRLIGVQHHHAHIASCLADNGEVGPVIGVAFDGTGYGTDGTIWGGEFLIADLAGFERAGHLAPVPMPGGTAAIRQPWRMAAAYLDAAYSGGGSARAGDSPAGSGGAPARRGSASARAGDSSAGSGGGQVRPAESPGQPGAPAESDRSPWSRVRDGRADGLDVVRRAGRRWGDVLAIARAGVNSPLTSSAGRLFDAVAAILGVRDTINYEGQAAVELEQLADPAERGAYRIGIELGRRSEPSRPDVSAAPFLVAGTDLVRAVCDDLAAGAERSVVAARFHNGVAVAIEEACVLLRERCGLNTVALSGGVFQNLLLQQRVVDQLERRGFRVLLHSRVPCNDGGISLGQAVIAATIDQLATE